MINLIINEEDKTAELINEIYINENGTIYISEEDVRNLFDSTIYYDEKYNQIITTSDTKVANIEIDEKQMTINSSTVKMLDAIIKINDNIYLPISDMTLVYNIEIDYIEETNRVVIDRLDTGMIRAIVLEDTDIKFKPRALSKDVKTVKQGETVTCYYTTSRGWRQIRTSDGIIGYIKANKLGEEYIVRQDMDQREEAIKISRDSYNTGDFEVIKDDETIKIVIESIFNMSESEVEVEENDTETEENDKVWAEISNENLENQTNIILEDYEARTTLIDIIVNKAIENNINGVSINFSQIENEESMERFVIELAPKLREVGITTCIVLNDNIEEENYINIVDYVVE